MNIEFDSTKDEANQIKHGISLNKASCFIWQTATISDDLRADYGEDRFIAQGYIGQRLHILIFTLRGRTVRVISLRKANRRERNAYEKTHQKT